MSVRVAVTDRQTLRRLGLRSFIDGDPAGDLEWVGEARFGDEALELVSKTRPDVMIVGPDLEGDGGSVVWLCLAVKLYANGPSGRAPRVLLHGGAEDTLDGDAWSFYERSGAESFVHAR